MTMRIRLALAILSAAAVAALQPSLAAQDQTVRIRASAIVDGAGGPGGIIKDATIVVQGSKITAIDTTNAGAATYDLRGLTVMPGMIDVRRTSAGTSTRTADAARPGSPAQEILYSAENAYVTLMAGFTTIRSRASRTTWTCGKRSRGVFPRRGSDVHPHDQRTHGRAARRQRLATPDEAPRLP